MLLLRKDVRIDLLNFKRRLSPQASVLWNSTAERRKFVRAKSRNNLAAFSETRTRHAAAALCTAAAPTLPLRDCAAMASSQSKRHVSMASVAAWKAASRWMRRASATCRPRWVSRRKSASGDHSTKFTASRASVNFSDNTLNLPRATERHASPAPLPRSAVVASVMISAHSSATCSKAASAIFAPLAVGRKGNGNKYAKTRQTEPKHDIARYSKHVCKTVKEVAEKSDMMK
mmetsp:Transcript_51291/g.148098  ORF Transcript_51291/g.148098 Transcript_51291/m.148098 type:complete len:231 (+) Transcript_51291:684-1376(+)